MENSNSRQQLLSIFKRTHFPHVEAKPLRNIVIVLTMSRWQWFGCPGPDWRIEDL
jgi:hypothetical protein